MSDLERLLRAMTLGLRHTACHDGRAMAQPVNEGEQDAVRLLRASWWENAAESLPLPVQPRRLAQSLGIRVEETFLGSDESGRIVIPASGEVTITLNMFDHPNRQRFTCAHEIGHYIRRRKRPNAKGRTFVDYRNTLAGTGLAPEEIHANQFAAALLMPAHLVERLYAPHRPNVDELAATFGTSTQAVGLRLRNLRLV